MATLADIKAPVEQHLKEFGSYYADILHAQSYSLRIVFQYALRHPGKQLRPLIVYLAAGAAGHISPTTQTAAAMVELVHNASLFHDDVVDQADLRRGFPTIHRLWKAKGAVLAGDYMLALGLRIAVQTGQYALLERLSGAVQVMATGELEQLRRARKQQADEEGYYTIIKGKTAALMAACAAAGAISANAPQPIIDTLDIYGENLGIAFQIQDDILDFSSKTIIGKPTSNDLREGKITLPTIYALEGLPKNEYASALKLVRSAKKNRKHLAAAVQFVKSTNSLERATQRAEHFTLAAKAALEPLEPSPYKTALLSLADLLTNRKK